MRKSRFTESVVAVVKEGEAGVPVAGALPEAQCQPEHYFKGKAKYVGA